MASLLRSLAATRTSPPALMVTLSPTRARVSALSVSTATAPATPSVPCMPVAMEAATAWALMYPG